MSFLNFGRRRDRNQEDREAEIQAIRQQTLKKATEAAHNTRVLIQLLKDDELGVAGKMFYASGGIDRQKQKGKKK